MMKKFGSSLSTIWSLSDRVTQSVLDNSASLIGVAVETAPGPPTISVLVLMMGKRPLASKGAAEFFDLVGLVGNKTDEGSAQVSVDAGSIHRYARVDELGARVPRAAIIPSQDSSDAMIEVLGGGEVVGLLSISSDIAELGVQVAVVGGGRRVMLVEELRLGIFWVRDKILRDKIIEQRQKLVWMGHWQ